VGLLCLFCVLLSATLSQRLGVLFYASPFAFFCFFCGECAVPVSRRDAEAQRFGAFCIYAVCFEASLSQRLGVLFLRFALCVLMCPYVVLFFTQRRKDRKGCGFAVVAVYLSATLSQRLGVLIYASPFAFFCFFCGECAVPVSRRDAEALCLLCLFCVF